MFLQEKEKLLEKIDVLRHALNTLATHKAYTDPAVVLASQRLDYYISQYYTLMQERAEFNIPPSSYLEPQEVTMT